MPGTTATRVGAEVSTARALLLCALWLCAGGAQANATVAPVEDWARHEQATYGTGPLAVHLRTGHRRPLIMPEPVRLDSVDANLGALGVDIDTEVVVLAPASHLAAGHVVLTGLRSGLRYRLLVSASAAGSRIPLLVKR